jgi:hypothetical protein
MGEWILFYMYCWKFISLRQIFSESIKKREHKFKYNY